MEDQQIIELFWARSESAVAELEKKYGSQAMQLAKGMLRSSRDAEECVSDAMHALWDGIPPERPEHLWAYFSRVLRNICGTRLGYLHAAKRDRNVEMCLSELESCFAASQTPQDILESRHITQAINRFLDTQDKTNRIIFLRRFYYFDSCGDIAKRLEITRGAVNTRLSRLRAQLREYLQQEEIFL